MNTIRKQILADRSVTCPECGQFVGIIMGDNYPESDRECCRQIVEDIRDLRRETLGIIRTESFAARIGVRP